MGRQLVQPALTFRVAKLSLGVGSAIGQKLCHPGIVLAFILAIDGKKAQSGALSDDHARRVHHDRREPGRHLRPGL